MSEVTEVDQAIRSAGLRRTVPRAIVAATLRRHAGHQTVDEIANHALHDFPDAEGVAKSTIYRALGDLEAVGLVTGVRSGQAEARFEWIGDAGQHHHLVCAICGRVEEVELISARAVEREAKRAHGFEVRVRHLMLEGLCGECASDT
ncbi:MAG: transcriptional repressor [Dehalococcoidia bacterium]